MVRILAQLCLPLFLFVFGAAGAAQAKMVVAFGYLNNSSGNINYNYLETIFPNSFASSIQSIYDVDTIKPLQIEEVLNKKNMQLKKTYEYGDLPGVADAAGADIFIFGSFTPLPNNRIQIVLQLYMKDSREVFSFTNVGKMETEIFKLVDRISLIVTSFLNDTSVFKLRGIPAGSRIAILTNIDGSELNRLYAPFLEKGCPVICMQSNDLHAATGSDRFGAFWHIRTRTNSFDSIADWRSVSLKRTAWNAAADDRHIRETRAMYSMYEDNLLSMKNDAMEKLKKAFNNRVDVLLIVGFSNNRKTAWLRAIDVNGKELIWMQSPITPDSFRADPITAIGEKIASSMEEEIKNPFEK